MQEPQANQPQAVHFGAGNIGRGFIGALLAESGYFVFFADIDKRLVKELNTHASYDVLEIHFFSGTLSQTDDVLHHIANPNTRLITTAVGPNILENIAPVIAKGLKERYAKDAGPLNVIACENMIGQTEMLGKYVKGHLSDEENIWLSNNVGFANCSVDRIDQHAENPLDVGVEDFSEWAVDERALRMPIDPPVRGMTLTDSLEAYIERKLFTLNCGHAITAYLGFVNGLDRIDRALANEVVMKDVRGALREGGAALVKKHGFDPADHERYVERVLARFANSKLHDDVVRVGRQPLRKLAKGDRLLGPTVMARVYGLPIDHLHVGSLRRFCSTAPSPNIRGLKREVRRTARSSKLTMNSKYRRRRWAIEPSALFVD
ncbi:mannitol dehydrogenase C-terminal domain-containing protein [Multifurca ochricompacta]|uniref:Mannitol dehydrogenase C-terminal domain-containing protein n=1 Tax=Multifurca ochricompacta TaxID=376703 RepID=A0AAD4LWC4_9AGAM|nr:mannitol dehydrogenase C-terminal domain-containing protein [Multifurca ochricompacta]